MEAVQPPGAVEVPLRRTDPAPGEPLELPAYAHPDDAGADLRTTVDVTLGPGERATVPTGIAIALPPGHAAFVHPRSGLAARHGLTVVNAPGTVDAGYRGEIRVTLLNTDRDHPVELRRGDRIAQLVVQRVERVRFVEVDSLEESVRGAGGFGSTGGYGNGPGDIRVAATAGVRGDGGDQPPRRGGHVRLFGRGRTAGAEADEVTDGDEVERDVAAGEYDDEYDEDDEREPEVSDRSGGPWDLAERPDLEGYVDLGGLRLRGREGMELRLELDEATGGISSATVQLGSSAVQLQAFAAPRSEGIWAEIRAEIADGITRQGGTADEVPGSFGRELIARIPARSPDGRTGHTAARFVGVDGPRWFLRAVFHGEAVHKEEAAAELEEIVRELVVVRGPEAMAPRELLPLHLPDQAAPPVEADNRGDDLRPFERGPEITEVR